MERKFNRIRFVVKSLDVGGAEKQLVKLIPALIENQWEVKIICQTNQAALSSQLPNQRVNVSYPPEFLFEFGRPSLSRVLVALYNVIAIAYDMLKYPRSISHFILPESYILGMAAAALTLDSSPKIMSRRSLNNYQKNKPFAKTLEKKLHRFSTLILANSRAVYDQLRDDERVPESRLRIIHNGLNLDEFLKNVDRKRVREEFKIGSGIFLITIVANLWEYKGHKDLLIGLRDIDKDLKGSWHLLCVGADRGYGEVLKAIASELGIGNKVTWAGDRTNVNEILLSSDVGVLPSHEEGFSNALLEMMAAGLPIVASDVGGNSDAIQSLENGILVPAKSPAAIGEALLRYFKEPSFATDMGQNAKARAFEKFSMKTCENEYLKLYGSIGA